MSTTASAGYNAEKFVEALNGFWGCHLEHPEILYLSAVPNLPAGYSVISTPFWDGEYLPIEIARPDGSNLEFSVNRTLPEFTTAENLADYFKKFLMSQLENIQEAVDEDGLGGRV